MGECPWVSALLYYPEAVLVARVLVLDVHDTT